MKQMTESQSYPDEAAFHAAWQAVCASDDGAHSVDEVEMALKGGVLADRLAWIFVSGYQAAVRRCFPEFARPSGWTCLAAAEAGEGPGCHLEPVTEGFQLSGNKSWIAGAGQLDSLVVLVGQGDGMCFVSVAAEAPGVCITLPRTPGFLGEMTQGAASFDSVAVPEDCIIRDPGRRLEFRGAEPLYVLLAMNACVKARADEQGDRELSRLADEAIEHGRTLPAVLGQKSAILPGLARLRALTAPVVTKATPVLERYPALAASWQKDHRLFAMFGIETEENAA